MSFWDCLTQSQQLGCIDKTKVHKVAGRTAYYSSGKVREKWKEETQPAIKRFMNDSKNKVRIYGRTSSKHPLCSFSLFMLDYSPIWKPIRPTIVVSCAEKRFAKQTVGLLERMSELKKSVLGFDFLIREEIILVADHSDAASPVAQPSRASLCGARVLISPSQTNHFWARATIGGVIVIDGSPYALTAAHAFFRAQEDAKPEHSDVVSSNGTASTISDGDDQDHGNNVIALEAASQTQFHRNRRETEMTQMESRSIYLDDRSSPAQSPSVDTGQVVQKPASIGDENLIGTIETPANTHHLPSSQFNLENDWALFEISSSRFQMPNTIQSPAGDFLEAVNVAQTEPNGPVLVAAGVSGIWQTECSALLSGIILPNSRKMLDAWTLSASCMPGDCGAWFLDRQSGDVFGMIVATSYELQESYCLPLSAIFDSILASRPIGSTISFPNAVNPAYSLPPPHHSHSPSKDHVISEEPSSTLPDAQEPTHLNLQTTPPKTRNRKPTFEPTALSEQWSSDEVDQPPSKPSEEQKILQARQDGIGANGLEPTADADAEHSKPAQSRWTRVETREFPTAALDSLGVPWWREEGEETHIMVDLEIVVALRKVKAQHQSAHLESRSSGAQKALGRENIGEVIEPSRTFLVREAPTREKPAETTADEDYMVIEKGDRGPDTTTLSSTQVEERVLHALGLPFYVQDDEYHITIALDQDDIDEILVLSKQYRSSRGEPIDRQSNSRVYQSSTDPNHGFREVATAKYDLLFEDELRNVCSEANLPSRYARELVQKFRENRAKLSEAIPFLEDQQRNSAGMETHGLDGRRPKVTIVEEAEHGPWSSPPRISSPETIVSRTTQDVPRGTEGIVIRIELPPHHPPPPLSRRTYTAVTDDSDRYEREQKAKKEKELQKENEKKQQNSMTIDLNRPTWIRVNKKWLLPETLNHYHLPWEWDEDHEYIIIKQYADQDLQDKLFEHTRMLKERKMIAGPIEKDTVTTLKVRDQSMDQMYLVRKKSKSPGRKLYI